MLQGEFAISGFHFIICSGRFDFEHLISLFQSVAAQVQHRFHFLCRHAHSRSHFLQGFDFRLTNTTVALCYLRQETEQLEAFFITHVLTDLHATLINGILERLWIVGIHLLALFEEVEQNLIAFRYSRFAEVHAEELTDELHLAMHHLSVCLDDVRSHHQHREEEAIALAVSRIFVCTTTVSTTAIIAFVIVFQH